MNNLNSLRDKWQDDNEWWIWKHKGGNKYDLHEGILHLLHLYGKKNREVAGHCG